MKTARELQIDWRSSKPTSMSTIKSILRKYGLLGRIADRKPFLNELHVRSRLNWYKVYSKIDHSLFSDKCRLELIGRRREYFRRPKGTKFHDKIPINQ